MVKGDKSTYNTTYGNCRNKTRDLEAGKRSGSDDHEHEADQRPLTESANTVVPSGIGTREPQNGASNYTNGDSIGTNDIDINGSKPSYVEVTNNGVKNGLEESTCTKLSKASINDSVLQSISTSVFPCHNEDNVPSGGAASASCPSQGATVPQFTPEESLNLIKEEKKNPADGNDFLFLPSSVGHGDDYKETCRRERRLSLVQHQERLQSSRQSWVDYKLRFTPTHFYDWPDLLLEMVKAYCRERLGVLLDRNKKDIGTCWHIGEGNVVTCYHCIPETAFSGPKRLKWGQLNILFPHAPSKVPIAKVPIYNVQVNLPSASAMHDFAVLKLSKNGPFPPAFEHYYLFNDMQEEFPFYNIGYQLNERKTFGELIVDKSVVVQKPSERKLVLLKDYLKSRYGDEEGYAGLLSDGNVCQLTSLIQGASGGLGVRVDPNTNKVEVVSMYQKGYPKYYYQQTIEQREMFEPSLKIESGISMDKLFSEMTLGI